MTRKSGYKKGSSGSQGHRFETVMASPTNMYALDMVNRNHDETAIKTMSVQKAFAEAWTKLDSTAEVTVLPSIEDALEYVQKLQDPCGMVQIFVTGSTHLIGGMLALLEGHDAVV
jgi:folylpolyglutamate synthase